MVIDFASRRRTAGAETALDAFRDVHTVAEAERLTASIAAACIKPRPSWYAEDRPGDRYAATLNSGEVLAWAKFDVDEPLELMAWGNEFSGVIIWREAIGQGSADASR